jgi:hypothetical protein
LRRGLLFFQSATVSPAHQDRIELALNHSLDKFAHPLAYPSFDRMGGIRPLTPWRSRFIPSWFSCSCSRGRTFRHEGWKAGRNSIWTRSRRRREVEDAADSYVDSLKSPPQQQSRVEFEEFRAALAKLPSDPAGGPASDRRVEFLVHGRSPRHFSARCQPEA